MPADPTNGTQKGFLRDIVRIFPVLRQPECESKDVARELRNKQVECFRLTGFQAFDKSESRILDVHRQGRRLGCSPFAFVEC